MAPKYKARHEARARNIKSIDIINQRRQIRGSSKQRRNSGNTKQVSADKTKSKQLENVKKHEMKMKPSANKQKQSIKGSQAASLS